MFSYFILFIIYFGACDSNKTIQDQHFLALQPLSLSRFLSVIIYTYSLQTQSMT